MKNISGWEELEKKYDLNDQQIKIFHIYAELLQEWNKDFNLTNITETSEIISYHFDDSLAVSKFINFNEIDSICDIGTGAGFPGLPLKIKFNHLKVILIEVNQKKINFLNEIIKGFNLSNIEIINLDWRTFLRTTNYKIDFFLSRASLHTDELSRLFMPSSVYKNTQLIYWASMQWEASKQDLQFLKFEKNYKVGNKQRKFVFFGI